MHVVTTKQFAAAEELSLWMAQGAIDGFFAGSYLPAFTQSKTPQAAPAPVPVEREPQPSPAVPYIPPIYPTAQLPPVRPEPEPPPPVDVDNESGRVEIFLPAEVPVFIPEPTRSIPRPPRRAEPPVAIPQLPAPIPYLPAPIPARVPARETKQTPAEESDVAIDWGDIFTTSIPQIIEGFVGGTNTSPYAPLPAAYPAGTPAGTTAAARCINTKTGLPCKRRRRRRLLTESDFNDLMRIATLPNKQNVAVALAKAVGRR